MRTPDKKDQTETKPAGLCSVDDCGAKRLTKKESPNGFCLICQDDEDLMVLEFMATMEGQE